MRINENEGPNGKKGKFSQIWIRPNMALAKSHFFLALKLGLPVGRRKREKKKRIRRRRNPGMETIRVWNCMEFLFGSLDLWFGNCLDYLYGNTINLFLSKLG